VSSVLVARDLRIHLDAGVDAPPILDGASLSIEPGEIVALLGPSGVGKSTLLRSLAGLLPLSSGEIECGGARVRGPSSRIALAFQDPRLLPWLTLEQNVMLGLGFRRHEPKLSRREQRERAVFAIEQVGLAHAHKLMPMQLSGGMAQRAAFARCLARDPAVFLLDEPFSALDEVTRRDLQRELGKWVAARRTAVLLSTHDLDEALALSRRIVLLAGRPARVQRSWVVPTGDMNACDRLRHELVSALADARTSSVEPLVTRKLHEEGTISCATT